VSADAPMPRAAPPPSQTKGTLVRLAALAAVAAAVIALSACGSDDKKSSSTPAAGVSSQTTTTITAKEFAFSPATIDAKAGKVRIALKNAGKFPHELEIIKTDKAPDALEVKGKRAVATDDIGEISTIQGGETKTGTFDLQPGNYIYICNIPGHYADGMHGKLTVK
jgi:uncharacterized cupredoxin-like copper-binding protein